MNEADRPTGTFDHSGHGLPVEQALLLEEACDQFEAVWRAGGRPDIATAVRELIAEIRPVGVRELVALDIFYRRRLGEHPIPAEYTERFQDLDPVWVASI